MKAKLKLVKGSLWLRYNLGSGAMVLTVGKGLNDGLTWHRVQIIRNETITSIILDGIERATSTSNNIYIPSKGSASLHSPHISGQTGDIEFGNFTTNSYVYIGGLPTWYNTRLSMLALPSVVFEPRFKGSIRNIMYAHDESGNPKKQEVMAYKVRISKSVYEAVKKKSLRPK